MRMVCNATRNAKQVQRPICTTLGINHAADRNMWQTPTPTSHLLTFRVVRFPSRPGPENIATHPPILPSLSLSLQQGVYQLLPLSGVSHIAWTASGTWRVEPSGVGMFTKNNRSSGVFRLFRRSVSTNSKQPDSVENAE